MITRFSVASLLLAAGICIGALSVTAKPTPTPTPTPTPRPTPTPTPTATPAPTATPSPSPYCPLPVDYGLTSSSTNSPEKPGNLKALCHHPTPDSSSNYIILCLPPSAYNAHIQHGDTALPSFKCTKAGNSGSCSQ